MKLYKILGPDRMPIHGGSGQWPDPGVWTAPQQIIPCRSGYHLCRVQDIPVWIKLPMELWEAEGSGKSVTADDKVVYEQARLINKLPGITDRLLQTFVVDCVEHVLSIYENYRPNDKRPRDAILATRDYLDGKTGLEELTHIWDDKFFDSWVIKACNWATSVVLADENDSHNEKLWQGNHFLELLNGT